ncbi:isomerase [Fragilaria crotonensis]|nr:isomerase [Fragilaria crotonensis]
MTSQAFRATATSSQKYLWIVRHGQAVHNPRAEAAREAGCTYDEFLELMRQDDALDADLTDVGENQGRSLQRMSTWDDLQLIVSSPLSRALRTADLVVPASHHKVTRVSVEEFREINGSFLNARRRHVDELKVKFPGWDFGLLTPSDDHWTEELETERDCAERGFQGLCWLMRRPEEHMLLVCHGGILRFTMQQHPRVKLLDRRTHGDLARPSDARFGNCELRKYELDWDNIESGEPSILLSEISDTA